MKLVCKCGDLALVVNDEAIAVENIGRVVRVRGPVEINERLQLPCWLIEPLILEPWVCVRRAGHPRKEAVTFASGIEHPDAWLLPLRPAPVDEETEQEVIDPVDWDAALVRSNVLTREAAETFWNERAKGMGYATPIQLEALKRGTLPTRWEYENRKPTKSRW